MRLLPGLIITLIITAIYATADVAAQSTSSQPQGQAMDKGMKTKTPKRGITMDKVKQEFGDAKTALPAVGEPPITRWQYEDYTVYFEHDRVITSVFHETMSDQAGK